jgi:hypothetical protein
MVRQAGNAPASSVWKTEILLLNDWRMKMAAGADIASASLALQASAHLSMPSSVKVARPSGAAPPLSLD